VHFIWSDASCPSFRAVWDLHTRNHRIQCNTYSLTRRDVYTDHETYRALPSPLPSGPSARCCFQASAQRLQASTMPQAAPARRVPLPRYVDRTGCRTASPELEGEYAGCNASNMVTAWWIPLPALEPSGRLLFRRRYRWHTRFPVREEGCTSRLWRITLPLADKAS
jgi:hypothetical protein